MAAKKPAAKPKPVIDDDRAAQIRADARSGTNWAEGVNYGPACVCGAFKADTTVTSWGRRLYKGACYRHGIIQHSRIAN